LYFLCFLPKNNEDGKYQDCNWVKQLSPIKVSEEETVTLKEYKALQKENQRLKIENEILKKATAIFAKEQ